jgi:hypothetical protein
VDITLNSAPVCDLPEDQFIGGCAGQEIALPVGGTDVDNNFVGCEIVSGPGVIENGQWLYSGSASETFDVTIRCLDECGAFCEGTFSVTLEPNLPPVCDFEDQYFSDCDMITAVVPLNVTDPDGNLRRCEKVSGPGAIQGTNWVYTAGISGTFEVVIECSDDCGATCQGSFFITFDMNDPPECNLRDTTIVVCGPGEARILLDVFDPDGNLAGCELLEGPGTIEGNWWVYQLAEDQPVDLTIKCIDSCGMFCISSIRVDFEFADVVTPLCDFPLGDTVFLCGPGEFCFDMPLICNVTFGMGKVDGVDICFEALEEGEYWAAIECEDACGNTCQDTAYFIVVFTDLPDCNEPMPTLSMRKSIGGPTVEPASSQPCDCPKRGDLNGDGELTAQDLSDLSSLFADGNIAVDVAAGCPAVNVGDVNCDGNLDMRDIQYLSSYLFRGGLAPCSRCADSAAPLTDRK